ncbi:MAG: serine--tRNA ligase, partial [Brevibacterium aurantiacum]|nr:serine--tRNA ligase [Brevibacterium aurantiacum]
MIDLALLRENPDLFKASQEARGSSVDLVDEVLAADSARRSAITAFEDARADQKSFSSQIAKAPKDEKPALIAAGKEKSAKVKALQAESEEATFAFDKLASKLPNLIVEGIPSGGEENFVTLKTVGEPRDFSSDGFEPADHLEIGETLKAIDTARGTKVAGSR